MGKHVQSLYVTVEDYLKAEESASVRHEYIDGQIFAMTGASDAHNVICTNLLVLLYTHLRRSSCRAYINDMKVRVETVKSFYYPDIMVTCEPFSAKSVFKAAPILLIEVLSPSTRQIDRREKLIAYKQITSLKEYLVVYQNRQRIELYQKDEHGHWPMTIVRAGDSILLESLHEPLEVSLAAIYESLGLANVVQEDEAEYELDSEPDFC